MSGGVWVTADVITASRTNQKTLLVDTGTNVANISANGGPWTGQLAYATASSSGINEGSLLNRNNYNTAWGIVMHEIGRSTLTAPATSITVNSIPQANILIVLASVNGTNSGADALLLRFNNDSATSYAYRASVNNTATPSTNGSSTSIQIDDVASVSSIVGPRNYLLTISNSLGMHKVVTNTFTISLRSSTNIAAPIFGEGSGHWDGNAIIQRIDILTTSGLVTINSGSEVVVLRGA